MAPPSSTISYSGRIPLNNAETGIVATLRRTIQVTTNGSGQFSSSQTNDPSGSDNWNEYKGIFEEYRVLGIRFEYCPNFTVNSAAVGGGLLVHSILHTETAPAPSNISEAYSYGDARCGSVFKPFVREWKMSNVDESTWYDTNGPTGPNIRSFMIYVDQAGATIGYGVVFVTALVQFRSTRK